MNLTDYMKIRHGVRKNGGIPFALTNLEANLLKIDNKKSGWATKHKESVIEDSVLVSLLNLKKSKRLKVR